MDDASAYSTGRILIVDDEQANVLVLERMLARAGYTNVISTQDSRQALPLFIEHQPDLVLLDLLMPYLDGYAVMGQIHEQLPPGSYVPILVLTADVTRDALRRALSAGAQDFLTKPFDQTELLLRVRNLLQTRALYLGLQVQVERLERLYEQAQQAIALRDESLTSISHDIGQPLAAIRLTAETMQSEVAGAGAPDAMREELSRIDRAASQMTDMVGELSDIARLQMGRDLVLQYRNVDIIALVRQSMESQSALAQGRKIRLQTSLRSLEAQVDASRTARVLSNLLNNAIKYSPRGGNIVVEVAREAAGETEQARITVSDQGIGIPAADLPHVFTRFFRAGNVGRLASGNGIGLAGARQIVEQQGGTIDISSEEGKGTSVTLRLPLQRS